MFWTIILAFATALIGGWIGYKHFINLDNITPRNLSIFLLVVALLFLILQWMHRQGWFPEAVAGAFMAALYALIFGFFLGMALQQYQQKTRCGEILYVYRTFLSDILPNLAAIALILFGIFRTSLLTPELPFTPIRVTSGLSLIAIGLYVFTIRPIPEFRKKGLILLDCKIDWDNFLSYKWYSEYILEIEYEKDDKLKTFRTMIPADDHVRIEKVLSEIIAQKLDKEQFDEYEEL